MSKNIWLTSDHHFGHEKIIMFCKRPFETANQMDNAMIKEWNAVVQPGDFVYHLGDFSFYPKARLKFLLEVLNGNIFLLRGNHDRRKRLDESLFIWVKDYYEFDHNNKKIVLSHYPMMTWNGKFRGSYMLHGHSHGNIAQNEIERRMDVGVDTNNFAPYHIDEIHAIMATKRWKDRVHDSSY